MSDTETPAPRRRRRRRRVLALTGIHGAVGAPLLRRLDADERVERVVLLDRIAPDVPLRRATFTPVDLTATLADGVIADALARDRVETVLHCAFHARPVRDIDAAHELEVIGTRTLFRAVAHNQRHAGSVRNVVMLGHTMSYGARPDNPQYLDEDRPLRGGHGYPFIADKVAAEREAAGLRTRTGLRVAVARAAWTVGVPDTFAARMLDAPAVAAVLGADPLVQLVHIEDLVDAVMALAFGRHDGCFNVAGPGVLPLSTVIKLAGRVRAAAPEATLRPALQALWAIGLSLVPAPHVDYLRDTFVADTTRATTELGFAPRYATYDALVRHVAARRGAQRAA